MPSLEGKYVHIIWGHEFKMLHIENLEIVSLNRLSPLTKCGYHAGNASGCDQVLLHEGDAITPLQT